MSWFQLNSHRTQFYSLPQTLCVILGYADLIELIDYADPRIEIVWSTATYYPSNWKNAGKDAISIIETLFVQLRQQLYFLFTYKDEMV